MFFMENEDLELKCLDAEFLLRIARAKSYGGKSFYHPSDKQLEALDRIQDYGFTKYTGPIINEDEEGWVPPIEEIKYTITELGYFIACRLRSKIEIELKKQDKIVKELENHIGISKLVKFPSKIKISPDLIEQYKRMEKRIEKRIEKQESKRLNRLRAEIRKQVG